MQKTTLSQGAAGELFTHFVCRTAGLPVARLEELRATESLGLFEELRACEREKEALREGLTDGLHLAIGGQEDRRLRRALLQVRRDIHNLRSPSAGKVKIALEGVESPLDHELRRFQELDLRTQELAGELERSLKKEWIGAREKFQELVQDEDFGRGLLLSTRVLLGELPRYRRAKAKRPGAKARQVERSLMRYYSRTVMKATPFATFCSLLPGRLSPEASGQLRFQGDPATKKSVVRLNKTIYSHLSRHLWRRETTRTHLPVELNPTLQPDGQRLLFLLAADGREIFQRMEPNPVLQWLHSVLRNGAHQPLRRLVEQLSELEEIDASPEEAEAFLVRLLEIGFLRFRLGIAEQEVDWDRPLVEMLQGVEDEHAGRMTDALRELRRLGDAYLTADLNRRREHLDQAQDLLRDLFETLNVQPRPPATLPPFYEDAGGEARLELASEGLEEVLSSYSLWTSRLSWFRCEQASMRHFFETYYTPEDRPVPLLRFYEDYYREHFKEHLRRRQQQEKSTPGQATEQGDGTDTEGAREDFDLQNPFELDLVEKIVAARKAFQERIRDLWQENPLAEEIHLKEADLARAISQVPPSPEPRRSISVFAHHLPEEGERPSRLMLNGLYTGFGKYFSRFLVLLPEEVQEDLRDTHRDRGGPRLAEICGDANFNANLHPPILPWEISYPSGESGVNEMQIRAADLSVDIDPRNEFKLRLRQGSDGPEVVPVDLGFLNPRMRPPLFQLLSHFTPAAAYTLHLPESPVDESNFEPPTQEAPPVEFPTVIHRPRITYENRLVLGRRKWWLTTDAFPSRQKGEDDAAYFVRVQRWRESLGLPREIFLRLRPLPQTTTSADSKEEKTEPAPTPAPRLRQHLYKPQYIDFANPLLVDLFGRASENLVHFIATLEECLPGKGHLAVAGDDRFVTEQIFQLDFPTDPDEAPQDV